MTKPTLYIGNKNYSSWSMRPWLVLRWAGIAFDEQIVNLYAGEHGAYRSPQMRVVSPTGKVPVLHLGNEIIWDSLAIAEWAAEQQRALWPADPVARALARCAAAEMHSGFANIRRELPMNLRRRAPLKAGYGEATQAELSRLETLWTMLRNRFAADGPWLVGQRSIVDAMFAPVCTRLHAYCVPVSELMGSYIDTLRADADYLDWHGAGIAEETAYAPTDDL